MAKLCEENQGSKHEHRNHGRHLNHPPLMLRRRFNSYKPYAGRPFSALFINSDLICDNLIAYRSILIGIKCSCMQKDIIPASPGRDKAVAFIVLPLLDRALESQVD